MMDQDSIQVFQSGIWQLNSTVISSKGFSLVVDAGYFPKELKEIKSYAESQGQVQALAFTHGHWDHIQGPDVFPSVPVWVSPAFYQAVTTNTQEAQTNQRQVEEFDSRWYVQRNSPFVWPKQMIVLSEEEIVRVGEIEISPIFLPGHSKDGLGFFLPKQKALLVGDYLSPCEIPFIDQAEEYQNTLHRLLTLLPHVNQVIPGHGPCLSSKQAMEIAQQDLAYINKLSVYAKHSDQKSALLLQFPRAQAVVGMKEAHLENCQKLGLLVP